MTTANPASKPVQTYVFLGRDDNGAFSYFEKLYKNQPNHTLITFREGETIQEAVARAHIVSPANIILGCHGYEGGFKWNKTARPNYSEFFSALPNEGIEHIGLRSCFAGSAITQEHLKHAPEGAIVVPEVAGTDVGLTATGRHNDHEFVALQQQMHGQASGVHNYVKTLDNFATSRYDVSMEKVNGIMHLVNHPRQAIPSVIGIGGKQPSVINMRDELDGFMERPGRDLNALSWQNSVEKVQRLFDAKNCDAPALTKSDRLMTNAAKHINGFFGREVLQEPAEKKRDEDVARVAANIQKGIGPEGAYEDCIAYALVATYMENAGLLNAKLKQAQYFYGELSQIDGLKAFAAEMEKAGIATKVGNGDKRVTVDEAAHVLTRANITLDALDKNHDHHLSASELAVVPGVLAKLPVQMARR